MKILIYREQVIQNVIVTLKKVEFSFNVFTEFAEFSDNNDSKRA